MLKRETVRPVQGGATIRTDKDADVATGFCEALKEIGGAEGRVCGAGS